MNETNKEAVSYNLNDLQTDFMFMIFGPLDDDGDWGLRFAETMDSLQCTKHITECVQSKNKMNGCPRLTIHE